MSDILFAQILEADGFKPEYFKNRSKTFTSWLENHPHYINETGLNRIAIYVLEKQSEALINANQSKGPVDRFLRKIGL